jgi:hypothetical protein
MKTPLTDTASFMVNVNGTSIPVISADFARFLEIRIAALSSSQASAWSLIRHCDWTLQTSQWKSSALRWQEREYVHEELPLTYPPNVNPQTLTKINTIQEARGYIAKLEAALRQAGQHLIEAEKLENEMIEKIHHLETRLNEISPRPFGAN